MNIVNVYVKWFCHSAIQLLDCTFTFFQLLFEYKLYSVPSPISRFNLLFLALNCVTNSQFFPTEDVTWTSPSVLFFISISMGLRKYNAEIRDFSCFILLRKMSYRYDEFVIPHPHISYVRAHNLDTQTTAWTVSPNNHEQQSRHISWTFVRCCTRHCP